MITFKYEYGTTTITVTTTAEHAPDVVQAFREFLLAVGFHPNTVSSEVPLQ